MADSSVYFLLWYVWHSTGRCVYPMVDGQGKLWFLLMVIARQLCVYTEARMSKISEETLADLDKKYC